MHNEIVGILKSANWLNLVAEMVAASDNTDAMLKRIMLVLAATQEIKLDQKDALRVQLRAWYRGAYGDREMFADSNLHRKWKKAA